jgi:hypothetical protein
MGFRALYRYLDAVRLSSHTRHGKSTCHIKSCFTGVLPYHTLSASSMSGRRTMPRSSRQHWSLGVCSGWQVSHASMLLALSGLNVKESFAGKLIQPITAFYFVLVTRTGPCSSKWPVCSRGVCTLLKPRFERSRSVTGSAEAVKGSGRHSVHRPRQLGVGRSVPEARWDEWLLVTTKWSAAATG